jgi:hypothetical protein
MITRVLTGFTELDDGELDIEAANAVTGLTGNPSFIFTGAALTDFSNVATAYHNALGTISTGGKAATVLKNEIREALLPLFSAVAIVVNQQANGNQTALLSSGIKLASDNRQHHQQPMPINLQVTNGPNGTMVLSVKHSPVGDHGTVSAYTPATNTVTDPNTWTQKTANGHKITITGLTPGSAYYFTAAYKGSDNEALVWAPPISKIVSN